MLIPFGGNDVDDDDDGGRNTTHLGKRSNWSTLRLKQHVVMHLAVTEWWSWSLLNGPQKNKSQVVNSIRIGQWPTTKLQGTC